MRSILKKYRYASVTNMLNSLNESNDCETKNCVQCVETEMQGRIQ